MAHASDAIFFLTFYSGVRGKQNIAVKAEDLAKNGQIFLSRVRPAIPNALPTPKPGTPTTYETPDR